MKAQRALTPIKGLTTFFEMVVTGSAMNTILSVDDPITVSWGDGNTTNVSGSNQTVNHTYSGSGVYTVKFLSLSTSALTKLVAYGGSVFFALNTLPASVTYLEIYDNTITGDLADLPANISVAYVTGNNTITGDLADLPATMTYIYISGSNTITGDLADLPAALTNFYLYGSNTVTGDVADLPATMTYIYISGSNTVTGDVANFPATLINISVDGNNTLSGDLANTPANVVLFNILGNSSIADYSGRAWAANMVTIITIPTGAGLSATEVDNLLIDLSSTTWTGSKIIIITGTNAARTAASDAAVATLMGLGVTVTTN